MISLLVVIFLMGAGLVVLSLWLMNRPTGLNRSEMGWMYVVMHDELSNPLQSVIATLTNTTPIDGDSARIGQAELDAVQRKLQRLIRTTQDLKALAMQNKDFASRRKEPFDLVSVVQRAMVDLSDLAQERNVRLVYEGIDSVAPILGCRENLRRVVSNLVENAIKYSRSDCTQPLVVVGLLCTDSSVELRIEDNGLGMTSAQVAELGRQPQLRNVRTVNSNGSGLGWLMVKSVIENHRGTVSVESNVNCGTTVLIKFPGGAGKPA